MCTAFHSYIMLHRIVMVRSFPECFPASIRGGGQGGMVHAVEKKRDDCVGTLRSLESLGKGFEECDLFGGKLRGSMTCFLAV